MTVKFGIVGPGSIAGKFAEAIQQVDNTVLVAVASNNLERATLFAEKYHAPKAYDSYEALAQDNEVEIVYVANTHNMHFESVKLFLQHNKTVICEKPLVTNQEDAEALIELAKNKNVLLMEAMWTRCLPAFIQAKEWVKAGKIGNVKLIDASFCIHIPFDPKHRLYDPMLAGGSIYDQGIYPLHFAIGIMGKLPTQVQGVASICETGVDDLASMTMKFDCGSLASLKCGQSVETNRDGLIYGTEGHINVRTFLASRRVELYNANNELVEVYEDPIENGFVYQVKHITDLHLADKKESPIIPFRDTLACARIIDDLRSSWGL